MGDLKQALAVYKDLRPTQLWEHFAALNRIPRPSGQEAAAREYVQKIATAAGARSRVDERGNTVVYTAAQGLPANGRPIAIQTHLDMVCEKERSVVHDCATDPIRVQRDGDRIFATGTTLGADNGIGVAAALTLLTASDVRHGPLELVFTVEEETGLQGALAFDASLLRAKQLINLDSEDPTALTIGSAGAAVLELNLPIGSEDLAGGWQGYEIEVFGLRGGHSGVQIHEHLANAVQLLTGALTAVGEAGIGFRLQSLEGGGNHSAIPRQAVARLSIPAAAIKDFENAVAVVQQGFSAEWDRDEPDLALEVHEIGALSQVMSAEAGKALLGLLESLPHGVLAMSKRFPETVETSANLAGVQTRGDAVQILTSLRSLSDEELDKAQSLVRGLAERAGASVALVTGYPGWEPDPDSQLLEASKAIYTEVYGTPPAIEVVHGGLECGVIVSKIPDMDAISFGPLIKGAHTAGEHVVASSVLSTWNLLVSLLAHVSAVPGALQASE